MKYIICSIYDKACEAYMRPSVFQAEGQAIRIFEDESRNPQSPMAEHPEDYALFRIGTFDDNSAEITPEEPKVLRRAHEVRPGRSLTPSETMGPLDSLDGENPDG